MSLLGGSVKRADRPQAEVQQYDTAQQMRGTAAAFQPLVRMRLADAADSTRELAAVQGRGNADTQQAVSAAGGTPFQRAMTRTKALSKIAMMGDLAVRGQAFRDRASLVGFGQGLQSGTARTLGEVGSLYAQSDAAKMRADQTVGAARSNMYGSLAGVAAGWGYDAWKKPAPSGDG